MTGQEVMAIKSGGLENGRIFQADGVTTGKGFLPPGLSPLVSTSSRQAQLLQDPMLTPSDFPLFVPLLELILVPALLGCALYWPYTVQCPRSLASVAFQY